MSSRKRAASKAPPTSALEKICTSLIEMTKPFEDLKELLEEKAFEECRGKNSNNAIAQLKRVAQFFESIENKNEEVSNDLAEVYSLIGELLQYLNHYKESVRWFKKAVVVDDRNPLPFASLAMSYEKLGDTEKAVRSLEQEIRLDPGDYSPYLRLADLYDRMELYDNSIQSLERLLERDPDNIQALHKLICYHQAHYPDANVEFLRKRLLACNKELAKKDLIIWTFHMCYEQKYGPALRTLSSKEYEQNSNSMIHLLKAYLHSLQGKDAEKSDELVKFQDKNHNKKKLMRHQYDEFSGIFGELALEKVKI